MALQEDIVLGDTPFLIKESPERMIVFDKKTGEGSVLLGDFDKSAIKKDLTEAFKDWHGDWDIDINDIASYVFKQREIGNDAYINITDQKAVIDFELEALYKQQQQEDVWIKNVDKKSSLEVDETLKHTFDGIAFKFGIRYPSAMFPEETSLVCKRESDDSFSNSTTFDIKGNIDTAKMVVNNTIKYFDQKKDVSLLLIDRHLSSQMMDILQEDKIKNPQNLTVQLAKKAGYVQGVCECVAAIGDDHALGKKLLSEMNVTRDTAKKYANPETFKALEQGIFAPQQNLEQTHSMKR